MNPEFDQIVKIGNNKQVVRTPQFPGVQTAGGDVAARIESVRAFIKKQKRVKGFVFGITSGTGNKLNIKLSGAARLLLGWSILFDADADPGDIPLSVTLKVNNEEIVEDVNPLFFSPDFMDDEYYFFPRPLSGQDSIIMLSEGVADINMKLAFYYL